MWRVAIGLAREAKQGPDAREYDLDFVEFAQGEGVAEEVALE